MEQREDDGRHETRLSENIHNLNRRNAYDVFDSHISGVTMLYGRAPALPGLREPYPQETVGRRETKTWVTRLMDDGQLVSERDDFQVQRDARVDDKSERVEQRNDDG